MNKGHIPERTCMCCRKKQPKSLLIRLSMNENELTLDEDMKSQCRGVYICKSHECLKRLSKTKRYNVNPDELMKILKIIDNSHSQSRDYLKLLHAMKNSPYVVFGINMIKEDLKQLKLAFIATDVSDKVKVDLEHMLGSHQIEYIYYGTKQDLGMIFGKEEINVIGIKNKRVARGMWHNPQ